MDSISMDLFNKIDLRLGKIIEINKHPRSNKFFVLKVDFGNNKVRIAVTRLKQFFKEEELIGEKILFLYNPEPKNIFEIISEVKPVVLANFEDDDHNIVKDISLITSKNTMPEGIRVY